MTNKSFWIPVRSYKNAEYQPWEPQHTHSMFIKPHDTLYISKTSCAFKCRQLNEAEEKLAKKSHSFEIQ